MIVASIANVDNKIKKTQVIIIAHDNERSNEIANSIESIIEYSNDYSFCNLALEQFNPEAQILIATLEKIVSLMAEERLDLRGLKIFSIDRGDILFRE